MIILLPFDLYISKDVSFNSDQWKEMKFKVTLVLMAILAKVWIGRGVKLLAAISTKCMTLNIVVYR